MDIFDIVNVDGAGFEQCGDVAEHGRFAATCIHQVANECALYIAALVPRDAELFGNDIIFEADERSLPFVQLISDDLQSIQRFLGQLHVITFNRLSQVWAELFPIVGHSDKIANLCFGLFGRKHSGLIFRHSTDSNFNIVDTKCPVTPYVHLLGLLLGNFHFIHPL